MKKSKIKKLTKFVSLIETDEGPGYQGRAQTLYFHTKHILVINYDHWDLNDIDYKDLPVNEYRRADIYQFYDILEKYSIGKVK